MIRKRQAALVLLLITFGLIAGCKPKAILKPVAPSGYFKTQFQTESQFVVEAVVSDLAEQLYFAAKHKLPNPADFYVISMAKGGLPHAPIYEMQIGLDPQHTGLKVDLTLNGSIWSPDTYQELTTQLAQAMGLEANPTSEKSDLALLAKLLDGTAETIESQNELLSDDLQQHFTDPRLHEQAALLLGAFILRDHSGNFFDIRSPLSRLTTHLCMAQFLEGSGKFGVNGQLAEAILFQMSGASAPALAVLDTLATNDVAVVSMSRALQARCRGDFRPLTLVKHRSPVESVAWFYTMGDYTETSVAWTKLNDNQRRTIDFVRATQELSYSIEMGHELLSVAIPLEMQEINTVYELSQGKKLAREEFARALNERPDYCLTHTGKDGVQVRVIGWGQWANFLQRHLCNAISENFRFMNFRWGVPDEAKEFARASEEHLHELWLYPFVRRFTCTDVAAYHKSVDDGFAVTVATPHLVPAECWNYLCYKTGFAPRYSPNPNPHINEWHNHNPLPGTVYDLNPRLNHPSLINQADYADHCEELRQLAPYDVRIVNELFKKKYNSKPTFDQAMELYHSMLPWSTYALRTVANTVYDQPEKYEKYMLQAAELSPNVYFALGDYFIRMEQDDKGEQYLIKASENDPDALSIASWAKWRVRYYLKKGETNKAGEIAEFAGEVYSYDGLMAKGVFMEMTKNYDGAFQAYANIEERYNAGLPLVQFCQRYKSETGSARFDDELAKRSKTVFPTGMLKAELANFKAPPKDGVLILEENELLRSAGMKKNEVIVSLDGIQVHNMTQYTYLRDTGKGELALIVWQDGGYNEIKANPPKRKFGLKFGDYTAK